MTNKRKEELAYMRLDADELQACVELVERMREEKRLAKRKEKIERDACNAIFSMLEIYTVSETMQFLKEVMRTFPSD